MRTIFTFLTLIFGTYITLSAQPARIPIIKCDIAVKQIWVGDAIKYSRSFELPITQEEPIKFHESTAGWEINNGVSLGSSPNVNSFLVSFLLSGDKKKLIAKLQYVKFDFPNSVTSESHYVLPKNSNEFEIFCMNTFGVARLAPNAHQSSIDDLSEGNFLHPFNPGIILSGSCQLKTKVR